MTRITITVCAILVALCPANALAADLGPGPQAADVTPGDMSFFGAGWYIRGDLGYSSPQGPTGSYNGVPFDHLSVAGSAVLGGGVGYKINNWFRADVTADYQFAGSTHATYTVTNCCMFAERTRLGGWVILANGYLDLGNWSGITPYLGGGVGYAFTEADKSTNQEFLLTRAGGFVPITDPNTGLPLFNAFPTKTTSGFAWALEAGAAVAVAPSVKVDFNYRYLNIADARLAQDNFGVSPRLKSLGAHQFRIGVRYMFDE